MTSRRSTRARARRRRSALLAALAVVSAVLIGVLAPRLIIAHGQAGPADPGPAAVRVAADRSAVRQAAAGEGRVRPVPRDAPRPPLAGPARVRNGRTTPDESTPAVANLDPALLRALREAATDAARDRVELRVTSGRRSPEYQRQLLRDAIAEHGSEEEAARWVATPETSAHVSGDAVDIGPSAGISWLSEHGSEHGLCQIYENEPWHFELRPDAVDHGCPPMYANPTHDPRMRR